MRHTWSSSGMGDDVVEVKPSDPDYGLGAYFIGVYGGGGGTSCEVIMNQNALSTEQ